MKLSPSISAGCGSAVIAGGGNVVISFSAGSDNAEVPDRSRSDALDFSPGETEERKSTDYYNRLCKQVLKFEFSAVRRDMLDRLPANAIVTESEIAAESINQTTATVDQTISSSGTDVSRDKPATRNDRSTGKKKAAKKRSRLAPKINYTSEQAIRTLPKKFARLSPVEEQELVWLARRNDKDRERLVGHMMWLIIYQADRWAIGAKRSYFPDFVQEGSIALLAALDLYDPARRASFATYAWGRVKRAIIDYVRTSIAMVPLSEYAYRQVLASERNGPVKERTLHKTTEHQEDCHDMGPTELICTENEDTPFYTDQSFAPEEYWSEDRNPKYGDPIENIEESVHEPHSNDPCLCRSFFKPALDDLLRTKLTAREYAVLNSEVLKGQESVLVGNDIHANRISDTHYKALRKLRNPVVRKQVQELLSVSSILKCRTSGCMR